MRIKDDRGETYIEPWVVKAVSIRKRKYNVPRKRKKITEYVIAVYMGGNDYGGEINLTFKCKKQAQAAYEKIVRKTKEDYRS